MNVMWQRGFRDKSWKRKTSLSEDDDDVKEREEMDVKSQIEKERSKTVRKLFEQEATL